MYFNVEVERMRSEGHGRHTDCSRRSDQYGTQSFCLKTGFSLTLLAAVQEKPELCKHTLAEKTP